MAGQGARLRQAGAGFLASEASVRIGTFSWPFWERLIVVRWLLCIARRRRNEYAPVAHALSRCHIFQLIESFIGLSALQNVRFLDQSVHHLGMALLEGLLDETHHHDVALHAHVLPDVEAVARCTDAQLRSCPRLARQRATDTPFGADVETEWSVDVCLQAIGEVVEACVVGDGGGGDAAGEIVHLVCYAMSDRASRESM